MSIPYVYSITETRDRLGTFLDEMNAGTAGPLILGQRGAPNGVLLAFELFDEMRDQLAEYEAQTLAPAMLERTTHPAGTTTSPLRVLTPGGPDVEVTYWPDLVADLRNGSSPDLMDAIAAVAAGDVEGTALGPTPLRWFLVVAGDDTATVTGWHLIWHLAGEAVELVAAYPISPLLARAWQASPEPNS